MGLFNRYKTNLDYVKSAFDEYNRNYCNPVDYFVTEEDCINYINGLKIGQKLNKEWNDRRVTFWNWLIAGIGFVLTISIPSMLWLWLESIGSPWGLPASIISVWVVGGISAYVYNWVAKYFQDKIIYKSEYFPPVNEHIERLFDDYLWKCEMESEPANEKMQR